MSEKPAESRGSVLKWALWGAAIIGVAGVVYITAKSAVMPQSARPPGKTTASAPAGVGFASKVDRSFAGTAAPDYKFKDADGKSMTVADLKGDVVVLNLWATWCAPCKIEMPTLAKLQAAYDGRPVKVVTVSIDKDAAVDEARTFIAQHAPLAFYSDAEAKMPWAMTPPVAGMPTTVIYGKDGLERARISGEADWAGEGARALVDKVLAEG